MTYVVHERRRGAAALAYRPSEDSGTSVRRRRMTFGRDSAAANYNNGRGVMIWCVRKNSANHVKYTCENLGHSGSVECMTLYRADG